MSDDYLRVVLLDTLTPGQRCSQAVHVGTEWGSAFATPPRVKVHTASPEELDRLLQALRLQGWRESVTFYEPEAASGGPGVTAVAFRNPTGVVRAILRALPDA